uniref:Uncharacterized protein n=1 Tax=Rhizophora mucronata TaxID=61149 RepID=A0A2P2N5Y4_RHIMU
MTPIGRKNLIHLFPWKNEKMVWWCCDCLLILVADPEVLFYHKSYWRKICDEPLLQCK